MKIPCPHCNQRIAVPVEYYGTQAACPTCGGEFLVPEVEGIDRAKRIALPQEVTNTIPLPPETIDLTRRHFEHINIKQGKWCDTCSLVVPAALETCKKCGQEPVSATIACRANFERCALYALPFLLGALFTPLFGIRAFEIGFCISLWPAMIDMMRWAFLLGAPVGRELFLSIGIVLATNAVRAPVWFKHMFVWQQFRREFGRLLLLTVVIPLLIILPVAIVTFIKVLMK